MVFSVYHMHIEIFINFSHFAVKMVCFSMVKILISKNTKTLQNKILYYKQTSKQNKNNIYLYLKWITVQNYDSFLCNLDFFSRWQTFVYKTSKDNAKNLSSFKVFKDKLTVKFTLVKHAWRFKCPSKLYLELDLSVFFSELFYKRAQFD